MAGSKKLPVQMIAFSNKSHRSKTDLKARADTEIQLGSRTFVVPLTVKKDKVALKKWKWLIELYAGFDFITSADTDIMEQYCLSYSQYCEMIIRKEQFEKHHKKEKTPPWEIPELYDKTKLDHSINKKSVLLQQLGSKLYLDSVIRVKAIPIPKKEAPPTKASKFKGI